VKIFFALVSCTEWCSNSAEQKISLHGAHISEVYPRKLEPCIFDRSQHDIF